MHAHAMRRRSGGLIWIIRMLRPVAPVFEAAGKFVGVRLKPERGGEGSARGAQIDLGVVRRVSHHSLRQVLGALVGSRVVLTESGGDAWQAAGPLPQHGAPRISCRSARAVVPADGLRCVGLMAPLLADATEAERHVVGHLAHARLGMAAPPSLRARGGQRRGRLRRMSQWRCEAEQREHGPLWKTWNGSLGGRSWTDRSSSSPATLITRRLAVFFHGGPLEGPSRCHSGCGRDVHAVASGLVPVCRGSRCARIGSRWSKKGFARCGSTQYL